MSGLPHGLTEPLRYDSPWPWQPWLAAALVVLALFLLRLYLRRRSASTPPMPPPRTASSPVRPRGVLQELARLQRRHASARTYRLGCHELSELVRGHLEATRSRPFLRWTAREVARVEGDTVWTRLLGLLSELQFSRQTPRDQDFEGICDLTREVLGPEGRK